MQTPVDEPLAILARVLDILRGLGIGHMISGSIAASYYAQPRMTRDIDIIVHLSPALARPLALAPEFYCDAEALERAASRRAMANAIHDETLLKIDFIVLKDDPYHRLEFARRVSRDLGPVTADVVTAEDLILAKLLWLRQSGSAVQRLDLEHLVRDVSDLDWVHIDRWATDARRRPPAGRGERVSRRAHDTTPAIADLLRRRVLARSGSERVRMAARMFVTARTLAAARVRARGVSDAVEATLAVLTQLYGTDLTTERLGARMPRHGPHSTPRSGRDSTRAAHEPGPAPPS